MSYAVGKFWIRVGQIRNTMCQSNNFWHNDVTATEQAVNEAYDEACAPWFEIPDAKPYKPYDVVISEANEAAINLKEELNGQGKEVT